MSNSFQHQHTAHCESGVVSSLLNHHQLMLDEPLVFGLSSALAFVYFPFVKMAGMPLISYRMQPKSIIKNSCKLLGIKLNIQQFKSQDEGMKALDNALSANHVVGLQTSVFWLPYFPDDMRFHFNAHNLIVYGKEADDYLISDPVFEDVVRCPSDDLKRARFAKGLLEPKGLMYTINPQTLPQYEQLDFKQLIRKAILKNAKTMLAPFPFVGVRAIKLLAKKINSLENSQLSDNEKKLFLGHIVRMQEEIGTGGAGFRYIYASFLEQSASLSNLPILIEKSAQMTEIGDDWRKFASQTVKQCRRLKSGAYEELANALLAIAEKEKHIWQSLKAIVK